jgi:hypothetical protein
MNTVYRVLFLVVTSAAALLLAAAALFVTACVATLWLARAGWSRLTGRPVRPLMRRPAGFAFRPARQQAAHADVVDVQPKRMS